ncbi:Speckle-type POZ protein-like [Nymphon striatum]|nr:Speckle-type POZ protein-like [Nymphon striatum]
MILHCNPLSADIERSQCSCLEGTEFHLDENGDVIWKPPADIDPSIPIFLCETYTTTTETSNPTIQFYGDLPDSILEFKLKIRKNVIYLEHKDWCTLQCVKISTTGDLRNLPYSLSSALEEGFFSDLTMLDKSGNVFRLHTTILYLSNPQVDWSENGKFFTKYNKKLPEEVLSTIMYFMYTECLPDNLTEDTARQAIQVLKSFPGFEPFQKTCGIFLKSESIKQKIKLLTYDIHDCMTRIVDLFSDKIQSVENDADGEGSSSDSVTGSVITNPSKLCYAINQSLREIAVASTKFSMICDLFGKNRKEFAKEEKHEIIKFTRSRVIVFIGQLENLCQILQQKLSNLSSVKKRQIISYLVPEIDTSLGTTYDFLLRLKLVVERMISRSSSNNPSCSDFKGGKTPHKSKKFFASSVIGKALERYVWMTSTGKSESITKSWDQLISEDLPYLVQQLNTLQADFDESITMTEWKSMFKMVSSSISWILSKLRNNKHYQPFLVYLTDLVQLHQFKEMVGCLGLLDHQSTHSSSNTVISENSLQNEGNCLKSLPPRKESRLPQNALQLFKSGRSTDMLFEIYTSQDELDGNFSFAKKDPSAEGKYVIKAHRVIMAARCNWFQRALLSGMKESIEKKIKIYDANVSTFEKILEFLYCGHLETEQMSAEKLTDILVLSDRYEVDVLRKISEQSLTSHLNDDTTLYLLSISDQLDLKNLKVAAIDYIKKHTKLLSCEDFYKLTDEMQHKIYQSIAWTPPRSLSPDQPLLDENTSHSDSSASSQDGEEDGPQCVRHETFTHIAYDFSLLQVDEDDTSTHRLRQGDERQGGDETIAEHLSLSVQNADRLEECVSNLREVVGESVSREGLIQLCLAADYDINRALNFFFSS